MGLAFWKMGAQHFHFLKLTLHLRGLNLPFLMELGDLIFFHFCFVKIKVHLDLHIHR
jgi:hypothetical protein